MNSITYELNVYFILVNIILIKVKFFYIVQKITGVIINMRENNQNIKIHYKMYKKGKHWVFASITASTIAIGAFTLTGLSASAEESTTVTEQTVSQPKTETAPVQQEQAASQPKTENAPVQQSKRFLNLKLKKILRQKSMQQRLLKHQLKQKKLLQKQQPLQQKVISLL